jgi:hypothetical protein
MEFSARSECSAQGVSTHHWLHAVTCVTAAQVSALQVSQIDSETWVSWAHLRYPDGPKRQSAEAPAPARQHDDRLTSSLIRRRSASFTQVRHHGLFAAETGLDAVSM